MMGGGFGGAMGWGWIWPIILLLGLVALVWGLVRARTSHVTPGVRHDDRPRGTGDDRALEILRERYARGEISEQEMRDRSRALDEGFGG